MTVTKEMIEAAWKKYREGCLAVRASKSDFMAGFEAAALSRSAEAGKPVVKADAAVECLSELRLSIRVGGDTKPYAFTEADDDGDYVTFEDACAVLLSALSTPADIEPFRWMWEEDLIKSGRWSEQYDDERPAEHPQVRNIRPLYAAPVAVREPVSVPEPIGYCSEYGLQTLASKAHHYCISVNKHIENEFQFPIYAAAPQPNPSTVDASALLSYYERQIGWSRKTFGPALRTKGVIDHIRKELGEIEQDPHDLSEWVDVVILAMDGFWRHGGAAADLFPALLAKQKKNMARIWPDWRSMSEDQAIEYDRSHDALAAQGEKQP